MPVLSRYLRAAQDIVCGLRSIPEPGTRWTFRGLCLEWGQSSGLRIWHIGQYPIWHIKTNSCSAFENMKTLGNVFALTVGLLLSGCARSQALVASADPTVQWGDSLYGLRCRLFVKQQQPNETGLITAAGSSSRLPGLTFEIKNEGNKAIAIPVYAGNDALVLKLELQEEPDVQSPPTLGNAVPVSRELLPGQSVTCNVADAYFVAFGKHAAPGWIHFQPSDRLYHLTATVKTGFGELTSNTIETKLK